MDRKIAVAYSLLAAITTISASIAVVWFGPNSNLGSVPGFIGHSESVWILFAAPILLTVIGLVGAVGLASTRIVYVPLDELSPDAQRALERHRNAERRLLIGVGIVVSFLQLLVILNTAGFAVPFELGTRISLFIVGALFARAGNMIPKIPFFSRWWQIDRAIYTKVVRFTGWAFSIAGISVCLLAVFAPIENIRTSVSIVVGSAVGLLIVNALLQASKAAKKSE
jgi:hypothetical protein